MDDKWRANDINNLMRMVHLLGLAEGRDIPEPPYIPVCKCCHQEIAEGDVCTDCAAEIAKGGGDA